MKRYQFYIVGCLFFLLPYSTRGLASALLERDGKYEVNWSTGKIRFYGVAKSGDSDPNMRKAEQAAWADGLMNAEKQIPALLSKRFGQKAVGQLTGLSGLTKSTVSISTTYFGDQRVKVVLETSLAEAFYQLSGATGAEKNLAQAPSLVVVNLGKGVAPVAFVKIVGDNGEVLVDHHAPITRWFKHRLSADETSDHAVTLGGVYKGEGVIQVLSSEWQPKFSELLKTGQVAFLVK